MTYAILNLVLSWCMENIENANRDRHYSQDGQDVSKDYLEAQAELAQALKKVMKFN